VLTARLFDAQVAKAHVRCDVMSRVTFLGMPESYRVMASPVDRQRKGQLELDSCNNARCQRFSALIPSL
jgi:hypothetical protein